MTCKNEPPVLETSPNLTNRNLPSPTREVDALFEDLISKKTWRNPEWLGGVRRVLESLDTTLPQFM